MKKILMFLLVVFAAASCTENSRARNFGDTADIEVPCGQKVSNITWKKDQLWYSTVKAEKGYIFKTHNFREESSWGLLEGNYILKEKPCN